MSLSIAGWRCWFADGRILDSRHDTLPEDGCVGFVVYYEERATPGGQRYRDIVKGDWYVVRADGHVEAFGHRQDGKWDEPPQIKSGDKLIKSSPSLPNDEWERVRAEMMGATEWP